MKPGQVGGLLRRLRSRVAVAIGAVLLLVGTSLLMTACGTGETESAEAASDQTISATLGEFSVSLDRSSVPAGEAVFTIKNEGAIEHELVVMKTDLAADELPVSGDVVEEDGIPGAEETLFEAEEIEPGSTVELRGELTSGDWVVICNLPGHYGKGMATSIHVE